MLWIKKNLHTLIIIILLLGLLVNLLFLTKNSFSLLLQSAVAGLLFIHLLHDFKVIRLQKFALQETENKKRFLECINEHSSDGIVLVENGIFTYANESILKRFGYTDKAQFLAQSIESISPQFQPDGEASLDKFIKMMTIASKKGSHTFEWLHITDRDQLSWSEISITEIHLQNRTIMHQIWRNLDERKSLEKVLKEKNIEYKNVNNILRETQKNLKTLNKELETRISCAVKKSETQQKLLFEQSKLAQIGELMSMISHQWRQPLSAISTTIANAKMAIALEQFSVELFQDQLDRMERYTLGLSKTIDNFKEFFKPQKDPNTLSLDVALQTTLKLVQNTIEQDGIKVTFDHQALEPLISYENGLIQVFLNIITNSIDAFKLHAIKEPELKIVSYQKEDLWFIEISDNAGGIDKSIIKRVFDPYFSTKQEKNGIGLGLYMSKPIIEKHCNGNIFASNEDEGAKFTIAIPSLKIKKTTQSL